MADPFNFTNAEGILERLSVDLGKLCVAVTGYPVVEADAVIPKPEGQYILVDLSELQPLEWATNEFVDEEGITHVAHNYVATFTLTAYRGKPHWALTRIQQAFGLPYLRERFFPTGSPYAYSSCSSIARMRVPLNQQLYENRARIVLNFNATFVEKDSGMFEDVDRVIIDISVQEPSGPPVGLEAESDIDIKPGGDDEGIPKPNPPINYHDQIVVVDPEQT